MFKNQKWQLLLSSLLILLPCLFGIALWNELPEQIAIHWGISGQADGFGSAAFSVFVPPLILLGLHWLCILITNLDNKHRDQNKKVLSLVLWICPILSLYVSGMIYAFAFGWNWNMLAGICILLALMFIVIGNYMPKCKQNTTIGIKVVWTLHSEENWTKTHRFAGKVWVIGGAAVLLAGFLPETVAQIVLPTIVFALVAIPVLYSYLYYRKQCKEGRAPKDGAEVKLGKKEKIRRAVSLCIVSALLIACAVVSFTGDISVTYEAHQIVITADYYEDLALEYGEMDSISYLAEVDYGSRVNGFGSPRLQMGSFQNETFGNYTRYSYASCKSCVVIQVENKTLVISGKNDLETKAIYEELLHITRGEGHEHE